MLDQQDAMRLGEVIGAFKASVTSYLTLLCIGTDAANAAAAEIFPSVATVETRNAIWRLRGLPLDNYHRLELQVACNFGSDLRDFRLLLTAHYLAFDLTDGPYDLQKDEVGFCCKIVLPLTDARAAYYNMQEQASKA
jgi:hypothetical protein